MVLSEKPRELEDLLEPLHVDATVAGIVRCRVIHHGVDLVGRHRHVEPRARRRQLLPGDPWPRPRPVGHPGGVQRLEHGEHLLLHALTEYLTGHELAELLARQLAVVLVAVLLARAVSPEPPNLGRLFEPQGQHGRLELLPVYLAPAVDVEEVEGLLDLLLLCQGQHVSCAGHRLVPNVGSRRIRHCQRPRQSRLIVSGRDLIMDFAPDPPRNQGPEENGLGAHLLAIVIEFQ
mmetsp:Transcript_37953/g.101020  ORF Transcript_37953/g.101020 Transcript_37953/m.101020 type:complete len:233 (-) Transcript_37953:315-1013(-)